MNFVATLLVAGFVMIFLLKFLKKGKIEYSSFAFQLLVLMTIGGVVTESLEILNYLGILEYRTFYTLYSISSLLASVLIFLVVFIRARKKGIMETL